MSQRRDPVLELLRLLRVAADEEKNIGEHLELHVDAVAEELGVSPDVLLRLRSEDDGTIRRSLRPIVDRVHARRRSGGASDAQLEGEAAAARLARSARWRGGEVVLDRDVLLGREMTSAPAAFVVFVSAGFTTAIDRATLVRVRRDLPRFGDLVAVVGAAGLRFEWHGGRGRLRFFSRDVPASAPRLVVRIEDVKREPERRSRPTPLSDILSTIGFDL